MTPQSLQRGNEIKTQQNKIGEQIELWEKSTGTYPINEPDCQVQIVQEDGKLDWATLPFDFQELKEIAIHRLNAQFYNLETEFKNL